MTDQTPPTSIEPWKPPEGSIIISEEQFEHLEDLAKKRVNPFPWAILGMVIILLFVVGAMSLGIILTRPQEIIRTESVIIPSTVPTWTPSPTATRTPTATINATQTMEASPAWNTIRNYFERLSMADYGTAWHDLTERCKYSVCWDNFHSDYKFFIETMRRYGVISIQELHPELLNKLEAQAYVVLLFKKEMQPHSYRFFLLYDGSQWLIDSIEFISLVK